MSTDLYSKLVEIATAKSEEGYLRYYQKDLHTHDRATLETVKSGECWLWILRDCGTALFPIAQGHDPVWATYWIKEGDSRTVPSLCYLITVDGGTVEPISDTRAIELANIPHPTGVRVKLRLS